MREKNRDIIQEAIDEIEASLKDVKGATAHQSRLIFSLSAGAVALLENYLEQSNILKPGTKINHLWLKKKRENVKNILSNQITTPIDNVPNIDKILDYIFLIEKERNELVYGKRVSEDKLKEKINDFLALKKAVEND